MGGYFSYKNIGNNKIAIQFTMYRDASSSTTLDASITYMMQGISSSKNPVKTKSIKLDTTYYVSNKNPCASTYKVQKGIYRDTFTLGNDTAGYYIWYNRQARNYNISNIKVSTTIQTGMTWQGTIPPKGVTNTNPIITKDPVPILCVGKKDIFNPGFYDPDGDSLVFSFITPYDTGSQRNELKTVYYSGYSVKYPFGTSSPAITIDSTTGEIIANPKNTGYYVLAVQIDEYRVNPVTHKAVYLGPTVVDLEFIINNCGTNPPPTYVADTGNYKRTVDIGQHFCFTVKGYDSTKFSGKYDSLTFSAYGSILSSSSNAASFTTKKAYINDSTQFCWTPGCSDVTYTSPHIVYVTLEDQGCNVIEHSYSIYVRPRRFLSPPKLTCLDVTGTKYIKLSWDTAKSDSLWSGYNIYRKKNTHNSYFTKIKTIPTRLTTTWTDSTATDAQDTTYSYYLTSINDCNIDGATTDTFQTIQVRSATLTPSKIRFGWTSINKNFKDSFVVYGDRGSGWKVYDTVKTRNYTFNFCNDSFKMKVVQLVSSPYCASNSGIAKVQFDTTKPVKNSIINATVTSWNKIGISFNASASGDIAWYRIYRSDNGGAYKKIDSIKVFPGATTYSYGDGTVSANKNSYCYDIQAVDSCGHATNYGPHCVEKLTLTSLNKAVKLSWTKYRGYTIGKQEIYRYSSVTNSWTLIATPATTDSFYTDSKLKCAKSAIYKVVAYNTGSGAPASNSDSEFVNVIDTVAAPKVKFVTTNTDNSQTIRFTSISDKDVAKYIIYRWVNDTGFRAIDSVTMKNPDSVSYTIKGIRPDKYTYSYGVAAEDSCNGKSRLIRHNAVELEGKNTSLKISLKWHGYKGVGESYYVVERKVDNVWNLHYDSTTTDTTYIDTSLLCNKVYTYRIQTKLKNGELQVFSDTLNFKAYDTIPPDAPVIQYATVKSNDTVILVFSKSNSKKINNYQVFSSTDGGITFAPPATVINKGTNTYTLKESMVNARVQKLAYYVSVSDTCAGNIAKSAVHRVIWLNGASGEESSLLNWTPYKGFPIKKYYIQRNYKGSWQTIDSTSTGSDTSYTDKKNIVCNGTYGYRVIGLENGGSNYVTYSDSVSTTPFDTVKPAVVNTVSASVIDQSTVRLIFHTVSDPDVRMYYIYYRINHGTFKVASNLSNYTEPDTFLHTGSFNTATDTLSYMVFALDTCGANFSRTSETHATIVLKGTAGNYSSGLKWSKYRGFAVKNYVVERMVKNKWTTVATLSGADSTYTDGPVPCSDQFYRIRALDKNSLAYSLSDSIYVKPFDTVKPAVVDIVSASVRNASSVTLTFNKVPDKDVKQYDIYSRTNHGSYSMLTSLIDPTTNPVVYINTGLNTQTDTFSYIVYAKDSCSANVSRGSETHRTMSLSGSAGEYSASLKWSKYQGFGIKNFVVERIIKNKWTAVATLSSTDSTYTDAPVSCQTQYYRIRALDNASAASSLSDSISLQPYDTVKPAEPAILNLTVSSNNNIQINWQKSSSNDVKRYDIYRASNKTNGWTKLISTGDVNTYTDKANTGSDTVWCYAIRAVDSCANNQSGLSSSQCVNLMKASVNSCYQKINLSWTGYSGWAVQSYQVYRKDSFHAETLVASLSSSTISFIDSTVNNSTWYTYRIMTVQQGGSYTSYTNTVSIRLFNFYQGTSIRYASKTVSSSTNGSVVVKWQSLASKRFYKYYQLYSKPASGTSYTLLKDNIPISQDSFVNAGIDTKNADYDYYIQVVDSCGNTSNPSATHQTMDLSGTVGQLIHHIWWTPYKGWPVKGYIIQRIEKGVFSSLDTVKGTDTLSTIFPAPCNHTITYRIKAYDGNGNFAYSDTISRQAIDTIPSDPATITNASVLNGSNIRLNFTGADSPDVYEYMVQYARNGVWGTAGAVLTTNTPKDAYSFTHSVNTLNDYYSYTVITLDSCLNATMTDTFSTIQLKGKPLQEANYLHWNKFKGYGIKNYVVMIYQKGSWKTLSVLSNSDTALIHDSLHCYQPYYYKIMGEQSSGNLITLSDSIQLTPIDTITPPASQLRVASVNADHSVTVNWRYNHNTDIKYFEVWRSINGAAFSMIGMVTFDSTFTDKTANPVSQKLQYYIITIDSCNSTHRSAPSNTATLMNIHAYSRECQPQARISWTKYTDLPNGTDSVVLYRELYGSNNWVRVNSFPPSVTSYIDKGVDTGIKYSYKVIAYDGRSGLSSSSDTAAVIPWVYPTPDQLKITYTTIAKSGTTDGAVYLQWASASTSDSFLRGYHIYHRTDVTQPYRLVGDVPDINTLHYTHTGINTIDSINNYIVTAYNLCGKDGDTKLAHQPIDLQVTSKSLREELNWTRYYGINVFAYRVYRSRDGGNLVLLKSAAPKDSAYIDTNLACGHKYTYVIRGYQNSTLITTSDSVTIFSFDTLEPAKPVIRFISTDTTHSTQGAISISFKGDTKKDRMGYKIYRSENGSAYHMHAIVNNTKKGILYWQDKFIDTKDSTYSYYISSLDSCGTESVPSDTHTVVFLKAKGHSQYIQLDWSAYKGFKNWRYLLEKKKPNGNWYIIDTFDTNTLTYHDSDIHCHTFYMYRIRSISTDSAAFISFSNQAGDTGYEDVLPLVSQVQRATVGITGTTNGTIDVNWNASASKDNEGYYLFRSTDDVNWKLLRRLNQQFSFTDSNLNTASRSYFYKIEAIDSCGNLSKDYSKTHRSILLKTANGDQSASLSWNGYEGWKVKQYNIYRDGMLYKTVGGDTTIFTDTMALCINTYTYYVEAIADSTVQLISASNTATARPFDNIKPRPVYLKSASVFTPNHAVYLEWDASSSFDVKQYLVYRKTWKEGQLVLIDSTTNTFYYDSTRQITGPDCFYVFAVDHCGNTSIGSNLACLIILNGKYTEGHNDLNWNDYQGWPDSVAKYNVMKKEDAGEWINIGSTSSSKKSFTDNKLTDEVIDYCYQVQAVEKAGKHNATSLSTTICLHQDPIVYVPNAFTPVTTYGLNDKFGPKGSYIKNYHMMIYNRWGELIYQTDESKDWDGRVHGELAPEGVYMYRVIADGYNGTSVYQKGNLTIIR
jgi:gliding motility-associated-like protein